MGGLGKRKRESMEEIQDQQKRYVAFSKRREGLFKKAKEFASISGSQVAVLVVSKAGVVYTHGSPLLFHHFISTAHPHLINIHHRFNHSEIGGIAAEPAPISHCSL